MKIKVVLPLLVLLCALPLVGFLCDVGINPMLFDGSPLTAKFVVASTTTAYSSTETLNMGDAIAAIDKEIDSVSLFNITMRIVNKGTPGPRVSGTATFNGTTFLTLTSVAVDSFSTERSIFHLPSGFTMSRNGVRAIVQAVKNASRGQGSTQGFITVAGTSTNALNVEIYLTLYTQVFTPPPKN
jgi:hypothetical protein